MVDTNTILYFIISCLFGILLLLFLIQSIHFKRSVPFFIGSLSFGFMGAIFATLRGFGLSTPGQIDNLFLAVQLSCYGLQIFLFFLFLRSLESTDHHLLFLIMSFGFLLLQVVGLWSIVIYDAYPVVKENMWLLADMGYSLNALLVYALNGIPIYLHMRKKTNEQKPLFFAISLTVVSLGYFYLLFFDLQSYFGVTPEWYSAISIIGDLFPLLGLFGFLILYLTDFNYLYRLPSQNYILVVSMKYGPAIHAVEFENNMQISLQKDLIAGLISVINNLFKIKLKAEKPLNLIKSDEVSILLKSGRYVTVFIITESISGVLNRALSRYISEFEKKFQKELEEDIKRVEIFNKAEELIGSIFPFLKIKRVITGFGQEN
ncbi:MAG: hypothetical protein K9W44_17295 [Candidatus Lokiarchaeota archaeon]|nr:hypothetical protein [Candidatus Harpocratesius repetitus]